MLGCHVRGQPDRRRTDGVMRSGVAYPGFCAALEKTPAEDFASEKDPEDVDIDLPAQVLLGRLEPWSRGDNARIVAEYFDVTEGCPGEIRQGFDAGCLADIASIGGCGDALGANFFGDPLGPVLLHVGDDDSRGAGFG